MDDDDDEAGYPLDEAVEQIMRTSMLPDDAAEVIKDCVANAGEGWIVAWWMESPMPIEALGFMGNTVPSATGWNAIFVADQDGLGPAVIDGRGSSQRVHRDRRRRVLLTLATAGTRRVHGPRQYTSGTQQTGQTG